MEPASSQPSMTKEMQPDEWWKMFGSSAPNLQKLAVRILSQTSSSSGCERNWSVFEQIHSKRRNNLEHQRLNDLVYVRYNLNLRNRMQLKNRNYDPLDFTSIENMGFWVLDEEPTPELNLENLEVEIYKDDVIPAIEGSNATTSPFRGDENEVLACDDVDAFGMEAFTGVGLSDAILDDANQGDDQLF